MAANEDYAPSKAMVNAVVRSSEKLEGAAKLISMLEDKADIEQITPAELAAVRSIVETCAADLDDAWKEASKLEPVPAGPAHTKPEGF